MIEKLSSKVYVLKGKQADVSVGFGLGMDVAYSGMKATASKKAIHVPLGEKDETLHKFHAMASESAIKWPLMRTRRDFIVGKGIEILTRTVKDGKKVFEYVEDPETESIEMFLESIGYFKNMRPKALDLVFSGRYIIKMTLGLGGKIEKFERVDAFHCKPVRMLENETRVTKYHLNPNFGTKLFKPENSVEVPAFDSEDPTKFPVCIIDIMDQMPGQVYHPFAEWWGTENWTGVTNKIPKFHSAGLDNGYNIKYHISVPDDYFAKENYPEGMDEEKLKQQVLDDMGDSLSGVENADKVLYTFHKVLTEGRYAESGIKITPLPNTMSDDAYTKLHTAALGVDASGHRVGPATAGIDTGGGLGTSGKELEASANFQQGFTTQNDRALLIEDFNIIKKIMGWSRNKVAVFEDIVLYTVDSTPTNSPGNPNNPNNGNSN